MQKHVSSAEVIHVKTDRPEKNGPVLITNVVEKEDANGFAHNGYIIQVQGVDRRYMEMTEERVAAWLIGSSDILLKLPSTAYPFLHSVDDESKGKSVARYDDDYVEKAMNFVRNDLTTDDSRQSNYFLLVFPEKLDNRIFGMPTALDETKLTPKVIPLIQTIAYNVAESDGNTVTHNLEICVRVNVEFVIGIEDDRKQLNKTPQQKSNPLADQMKSMF